MCRCSLRNHTLPFHIHPQPVLTGAGNPIDLSPLPLTLDILSVSLPYYPSCFFILYFPPTFFLLFFSFPLSPLPSSSSSSTTSSLTPASTPSHYCHTVKLLPHTYFTLNSPSITCSRDLHRRLVAALPGHDAHTHTHPRICASTTIGFDITPQRTKGRLNLEYCHSGTSRISVLGTSDKRRSRKQGAVRGGYRLENNYPKRIGGLPQEHEMETYHGHVRSPADAIILFEACRLGLLPRVQRRLSEKERQNIKSGSVFVWDEREAGMRRWTDGKSWSASRVSGSFLTYREMEGKRGGNAFAPPTTTLSVGGRVGKSPNPDSDSDGLDTEGPDGYRYKPDGLMKQSFSITTATHQKLHLISYYARSHPSSQNLIQPTQDSALKHIRPAKGMYPESTVHEQQNVPVVTRGPMIATNFNHAQSPGALIQRPPGATHPNSYPQQGAYGWPPSPVSTPPTNLPPPAGQYTQPQLPLPNSAASSPMAYNPPTFPSSAGSPMQYDRTPLPHLDNLPPQPSHRGSMGSPMMHIHRSPRAAVQQMQRQPSDIPMPSLPCPDQGGRFSSPASSLNGRSPPRSEKFDINPLRQSPSGGMDGGSSPGRSGLEVQDIPSEKLGFGEDVRALRVLDRAFIA